MKHKLNALTVRRRQILIMFVVEKKRAYPDQSFLLVKVNTHLFLYLQHGCQAGTRFEDRGVVETPLLTREE